MPEGDRKAFNPNAPSSNMPASSARPEPDVDVNLPFGPSYLVLQEASGGGGGMVVQWHVHQHGDATCGSRTRGGPHAFPLLSSRLVHVHVHVHEAAQHRVCTHVHQLARDLPGRFAHGQTLHTRDDAVLDVQGGATRAGGQHHGVADEGERTRRRQGASIRTQPGVHSGPQQRHGHHVQGQQLHHRRPVDPHGRACANLAMQSAIDSLCFSRRLSHCLSPPVSHCPRLPLSLCVGEATMGEGDTFVLSVQDIHGGEWTTPTRPRTGRNQPPGEIPARKQPSIGSWRRPDVQMSGGEETHVDTL
eukprot:scaffold2311_cov313-Pavlova_lutheri.AAC.2